MHLLNRPAVCGEGGALRRYKKWLRRAWQCSELWHEQHVRVLATVGDWCVVDGSSSPISVLGTQGNLIALCLNASRSHSARARPVIWAFPKLKANRSYRKRESCHLKYIDSLISRVIVARIVAGFSEMSLGYTVEFYCCRFYCCKQKLIAEMSKLRINITIFLHASIFLFSPCYLSLVLFSNGNQA